MATLTARLQPWLEEEIKAFWSDRGEGPSSALRRVAEEWWVHENLPHLEFREGVSGRRAAIRGGPDVWEIALLSQSYDSEARLLEEHFGGVLAAEAVREAMEYCRRFPNDIRGRIAENERIGRMLQRSKS